MNTSEIWSNIERELLGLKWIGNTTRHAVDHPKREPQIGSGLFGIRLLIIHFKFQFSKSIKSSTFHIFLNLTYPLRKKNLFPKITQKFTQNRLTVVNEHRDLALFEMWPRYWQKGRVRWFPGFALRIPTAHDVCVISACKWARARTKRKRFPSN